MQTNAAGPTENRTVVSRFHESDDDRPLAGGQLDAITDNGVSASARINQLDDLIEQLQGRIMTQLERRGGLYQGAF